MSRQISKVVMVCLTTFFLTSCIENSVQNDHNVENTPMGHYKMEFFPISKTKTSSSSKLSTLFSGEKGQTNLAQIIGDNFAIFNSETDSLERIYKIPKSVGKVHSICAIDTLHWVIFHDSNFLRYNGKLEAFNVSDFQDDYIPLDRYRIAYFPETDEVVAACLSYKHDEGKVTYSSNFLNVYNLGNGTSSRIELTYPEQYHGGQIGIPRVYLKGVNNTLTVSFGLDDNLFLVDMISKEVTSHVVKSQFEEMAYIEYDDDLSNQEKKDVLQHNSRFADSYGAAFTNEDQSIIWRLYRPTMPENDGSYFLSSRDKGCHIVQFNLKSGKTTDYILANAQYYISDDWHVNLNRNLPALIYKKMVVPRNDEKHYTFTVYTITPFSF